MRMLLYLPHIEMAFVKLPPAQGWWNTDYECVGPDEDESQEGGGGGGQRELPVLGYHHVSLECQDR